MSYDGYMQDPPKDSRTEPSIFTRIINGEIPCHKVFEDDRTLAFLNIYPVQPGHVLVIPKLQVEFVWDLPDAEYQALMSTVKLVAVHVRSVVDAPYMHSRVVGVHVPHAHVHLIPFHDPDELGVEPDSSIEPDHATLAAMAKKLMF